MMICVLSGRTLIHWNIPSYNALQMLNFIMKSYQGLMCPQHTSTNLFPEKILLQKHILGRTNDNLRRRLDLLILFINIVVKLMRCPLTVHNCK